MIDIRKISHRFEGLSVLEEVSLSVADGEFLLIVGANGSGKTTLLRHCNGLLTPETGRVRVDGHDAASEPVAVRRRVGMVFQHPREGFVAATVGEDVAFGPANLGLAREEIDRRVEAALESVGMADRGDATIEALSGGEQARVAIAGALAMEPTHLLFDEPFTGLDESARRSVLDRLEELGRAGTSIIVATHDLRDLLALADRVVGMADGRIVLDRELTGEDPTRAEALRSIGVRAPNE